MKQFRIHPSSCLDIMGYPEKDEISKGAITYLETWVKEQLYGRDKFFSSRFTEKGTRVEDDAIDFAADVFGWGLVSKNQEQFRNDYIIGTPDVILKNEIIDIKSSWDCFTFPLFGKELDKAYWWQLQCYMELTGKDNAAVVYCLMDAPDDLVEAEARKLSYKAGLSEVDAMFYDEVKTLMTYSNLPDELRIKRFDVARDDKAIEQVKKRVIRCREHLQTMNIPKMELSIQNN